jgi:hypothetical protein
VRDALSTIPPLHHPVAGHVLPAIATVAVLTDSDTAARPSADVATRPKTNQPILAFQPTPPHGPPTPKP